MIKVLTIAGSDPSSGAGIQQDLKVFQRLGAFGMGIPAGLTIQNSKGVFRAYPVSSRVLYEQIETLLSDIAPDAVKTGMLMTRANVMAVARAVHRFGIKNLIIDTVIRSTSGYELLSTDGIDALRRSLLPLGFIATPNLPEAEILSGIRIRSDADIDLAATRLLETGLSYVLVKGGHRKGIPVDRLYDGKGVHSFSAPRRKGEFHGTGCTLSAAITVFIARGFPVEKAVEKARSFVDLLLKKPVSFGKGRSKYLQP